MTDSRIDSRLDTYQHIRLVQTILLRCIVELQKRAAAHDTAKLFSPEVEAFDSLQERLRTAEYGSDEYRAALREIKPAIQHHYSIYAHHPEHHRAGIHGMTLIDLLEMLCDWKAASLRQGSGQTTLKESMDHNQERFGFGDELKRILLNTVEFIES